MTRPRPDADLINNRLEILAAMYEVTHHTLFGAAVTAVGNANFGQINTNSTATRIAALFRADIESYRSRFLSQKWLPLQISSLF